jgi:hypothetical protein
VTVGPPVMIATAKVQDSDEVTKRQAQNIATISPEITKLETRNIQI